jgi:hypothetical protein
LVFLFADHFGSVVRAFSGDLANV